MTELQALFIGASTEDIMMQVRAMPLSNQRILAKAFTRCCGGVAANAAAAFRHLGGRGGVITAVGDDDSGAFIRSDLNKQNYAFVQIHTIQNCPSSISTIHVEDDGHRSITHYGGSIAKLSFEMVDKDALHAAGIVHMGVLNDECMLKTAKYVKENCNGLVSIDGGNLEKPLVEALLPYCDIYIPDDVTVARTHGMSPQDACRYFHDKGVQIACVTAGEKGSYACDDTGAFFAPAMKVDVVDTTGAGDNFHGAFLYGLTQGWDTPRCLQFSSAFASLTCRAMGGRAALPTMDCTLGFLQESNRKG